MSGFVNIMLYALWTITLVGVLVTVFTNFQYPDFNFLVFVFGLFAIINTFFVINKK